MGSVLQQVYVSGVCLDQLDGLCPTAGVCFWCMFGSVGWVLSYSRCMFLVYVWITWVGCVLQQVYVSVVCLDQVGSLKVVDWIVSAVSMKRAGISVCLMWLVLGGTPQGGLGSKSSRGC